MVPSTPPIPITYRAEDIFTVFARALDTSVDTGYVSNDTATELLEYLSNTITQNTFAGDDISVAEQDVFRNFLAIPLYYINVRRIPQIFVADEIDSLPKNMTVEGYFAKDGYRIVFSFFSIVTFITLAAITLIWCGLVLLYCSIFGGLPPNLSEYPEVDFASKSVGTDALLKGLGNAGTKDIILRFKGKRIVVGEAVDNNRVVMATEGPVQSLRKGNKYKYT